MGDWNDENYYMVAFDSEEKQIKHFRVDKMLHISLNVDRRDKSQNFKTFDMVLMQRECRNVFRRREKVKILCENELACVMRDCFEKDVTI